MESTTVAPPSGSLGLKTLEEEVDSRPLAVDGELPGWLAGTLVRVTPALLDPGGAPLRHWFDGLAMLNAFTIADGGVSYASRFLDSQAYRNVRDHGETRMRTFGSDPCRTIFQRVSSLFSPGMTDNCNVNVTRLGERWVAMTETPIAIEFDPETLATIGPRKWAGDSSQATAHPHYDFDRREAVSYSARFGPSSSYRLFVTPDGAPEPREVAKLGVREPAYMHSFALTDRYAVLFEQPLVVNPLKLALGKRSFIESYEWKPERGTRFLVIDRETGALRSTVEADAFFTFHSVNAFEEGGELVVDLVAYDDASIIDDLLLDKLRRRGAPPARGSLRRYRLPLDGGAASREDLSDEGMELPRISYRARNGRDYRYVYAVGQRGSGVDQLLKVDVRDRSTSVWHEDGCYPGEPVFVPSPDSSAEDEGAILSVVLDSARERSFLLVLDAGDMTELARAEAPHHIPFGFHGDFSGKVISDGT
jgi:carotenoid cleavage dioxygenase-like enzyme